MGPHGDAVLYGNTASNGDAAPHRNGDEAQRKERIIYDPIKVLLPPGNEPLRESGSDSEAEGEFGLLTDPVNPVRPMAMNQISAMTTE